MDTNQEENYSVLYQKEIVKIALKDLNNILLQFDMIGFEDQERKFSPKMLNLFKPNESKIEYFLDTPITISDFISEEEIFFTRKAIEDSLIYFQEDLQRRQKLLFNNSAIKKHEHFLFERMYDVILDIELLFSIIAFAENQTNTEAFKNALLSVKQNCDRLFYKILNMRYASFINYTHDFKQDFDWSLKFRLLNNVYSMTVDILHRAQNQFKKLNLSF